MRSIFLGLFLISAFAAAGETPHHTEESEGKTAK